MHFGTVVGELGLTCHIKPSSPYECLGSEDCEQRLNIAMSELASHEDTASPCSEGAMVQLSHTSSDWSSFCNGVQPLRWDFLPESFVLTDTLPTSPCQSEWPCLEHPQPTAKHHARCLSGTSSYLLGCSLGSLPIFIVGWSDIIEDHSTPDSITSETTSCSEEFDTANWDITPHSGESDRR